MHQSGGVTRHEIGKAEWQRIGDRLVRLLVIRADGGAAVLESKPVPRSVRIRRKRRGFDKDGQTG